jgi:hypothetical protein
MPGQVSTILTGTVAHRSPVSSTPRWALPTGPCSATTPACVGVLFLSLSRIPHPSSHLALALALALALLVPLRPHTHSLCRADQYGEAGPGGAARTGHPHQVRMLPPPRSACVWGGGGPPSRPPCFPLA